MSIASKNLYELLGNDADQDPELREPEPPTKAIDKPTARTGKRNAPAEAPSTRSAPSTGGRGGQRDTHNANENAFRDRNVGADRNRARGGDALTDGNARGTYRGRGGGRGRGARGGAPGDRHSRTGVADHDKQVAHGWGGQDGNSEWADEKAGEAIAKQDEKEEGVVAEGGDAAAAEPEAEPEPEDKTKSYAAYLAEQAEKKLALGATEIRKPNEGSSKKFPEGKAITRDEDEDFIAGSGGKAKRERQRKEKAVVELDDSRLHQTARESFRGRGRGRGESRGSEGRGRGTRGRGEGGRGRGGRGGQANTPNVSDTSAFPSLGA